MVSGAHAAATVLLRAEYIVRMRSSIAGLRSGDEGKTSGGALTFRGVALAALLIVSVACGGSRPATLHEEDTLESGALPVTVVTGPSAGPTVTFVAGVHGGKVAAIRAVERLRRELDGQLLAGRVLLVSPVNAAGYHAGLAQLSPLDSLNLNRVFPGRTNGAPTERLAARVMREIVSQSDFLVDMHGSDGEEAVGAFAYAARPGVDLSVDTAALILARAWGTPVIVWDDAGPRTLETSRYLQTAAHLSGVPAITVFETSASRVDAAATRAFVRGARAVLEEFGMLDTSRNVTRPATLRIDVEFPTESALQRRAHPAPLVLPHRDASLAPIAGRWAPAVRPGDQVAARELLGVLHDSARVGVEIRSLGAGRVLHQRLAGPVTAGTTLIILGVTATPSP